MPRNPASDDREFLVKFLRSLAQGTKRRIDPGSPNSISLMQAANEIEDLVFKDQAFLRLRVENHMRQMLNDLFMRESGFEPQITTHVTSKDLTSFTMTASTSFLKIQLIAQIEGEVHA